MATGMQHTATQSPENVPTINKLRRAMIKGGLLGLIALGTVTLADRVLLQLDPTLPKLNQIKIIKLDVSKLTSTKGNDFSVSEKELLQLRDYFKKEGFRISEDNIVEIDPSKDNSHKLDPYFKSSSAPTIRGNVISLIVRIGNERRSIENTAFNIVYKEEK